jgi:outer membrane immunogenic protein
MKRWAVLCAALLVFAGYASAQDHPMFEGFGGYSYVRVNPDNGFPGENFNGGSGSFAFNPISWLGVVADLGGYHWTGTSDDVSSDFTAFSYLFGPKVAFRHGPITPFAQALFGGVRLSGSVCGEDDDGARVRRQTGGDCESGSSTGFATAIGGGLDWNATSHLGIRLVQAEYVLTEIGFYSNTHQNNFRYSAGVVVRW